MANVNPDISNELYARFFVLNQKMFKENNMSFFKEYEALIKKFEGSKNMKFVSKLSTGKQTIDLLAFYKAGQENQPLYIWPNFQKVLDEATEHGAVASVEIDETFFQHQNTESITDTDAIAELSETIIDLATADGRLEARKRLGTLAFFLSKQPKAQSGDLITTGYANVIGWFKTKDGSVFSLYARWYSGDQLWDCDASDLHEWSAGRRFWSRNDTK
jgi:hypothetical protein